MFAPSILPIISVLLCIVSNSKAQQYGPQEGDTFTVEGMAFGPVQNISYPLSPPLNSSTIFNTSNAYERVDQGLRATVPLDSEFYDAIRQGIENFSGDVELDDSAEAVYTPANSMIPVNCSNACGVVEWHPHFTTWFGRFEPSGTAGSLSMPNEEGRGDVLVRCMACENGVTPTFTSDALGIFTNQGWKIFMVAGLMVALVQSVDWM